MLASSIMCGARRQKIFYELSCHLLFLWMRQTSLRSFCRSRLSDQQTQPCRAEYFSLLIYQLHNLPTHKMVEPFKQPLAVPMLILQRQFPLRSMEELV